MTKPCAFAVLVTGIFALQQSAGAESKPAKPAAHETTIVVRFPRGLVLKDVALAADGGLRLGSGVTIKPGKRSPATIANAGRGQTQVGANSQTASIVSVGSVVLHNQSQVAGEVTTAGKLTRPSSVRVSGAVSELALLQPSTERRWSVQFPATNSGDVIVASGAVRNLAEGSYRHVLVKAGAKLDLSRGEFFVQSLEIEAKGQLVQHGYAFSPAVIYSAGKVNLKGDVTSAKDSGPNLLLVALGSDPVVVERAFTGTLMAPRARLILGAGGAVVQGQVYAHDIEIRPGTAITAAPFPLDSYRWKGSNTPVSSDTDHDGINDYRDACPYDAQKERPGFCGCGVPDSDANGDGFLDCLGVITGDRNGRCGTAPACTPGPGCQLVLNEQSAYWICAAAPARTSHAEAERFCRAKGLRLARIDTPEEKALLSHLLLNPAWVESERRCRALDNVDGRLLEPDCKTRLGFVCEYALPMQARVPAPTSGPATACVSEQTAGFSLWNSTEEMKAAQAEFRQQIALAKNGSFTGAAANPPTGGTGDQIDLCDPKGQVTALLEPGSNLTPTALRMLDLFPQGPPVTTWSTDYQDPPVGKGTRHSWCTMSAQNPHGLATIALPGLNRSARISANDQIRITIDPDVSFEAKSEPLPFGDVSPRLHAQSKLAASVAMKDFLGLNYQADIVRAVADISASRCGLRTDASELKVLGTNVASPESLPRINSEDPKSPLYAAGQECRRALANYQSQAGDTKKAFRDAQQLLFQYHQVARLDEAPLCDEIRANAQEGWGFPGGPTCYANEHIELIISRFIYAYSPYGEIGTMRRQAQALAVASSKLRQAIRKNADLEFRDTLHQETRTIGTVPVTLGPVPLVVQFDLTVSYGMGGRFEVDLDYPLNLDGPASGKDPVARVGASALPHASAVLTAVMGADSDLASWSAVARVEGAVSLADVRAPLFASVGLERTAFPDTRPLPEDIKPPVARSEDAFVYGFPRRYQYGAIFEYGAGLDLLRVLDGAINTSLTVPVGTVNRTWRKPLVDLKGVSGHFDLVKGAEGSAIRTRTVPGAGPLDRGSATTVVQGRTPIGLWESEVPLVNLASPSGNARYQRPQPNDTRAPVDLSKLERVFYDDLCRARPGEACHVDGTPFPLCQMYSTCKIQAAGGSGICETQCRGQEAPCKQSSDCCTGFVCNWLHLCQVCRKDKEECMRDGDCCAGLTCVKNKQRCAPAQNKGGGPDAR